MAAFQAASPSFWRFGIPLRLANRILGFSNGDVKYLLGELDRIAWSLCHESSMPGSRPDRKGGRIQTETLPYFPFTLERAAALRPSTGSIYMVESAPTAPKANQFPAAKRRAAVLLLLVAGLALAASSAKLHEWLIGFLPYADAMIRDRPVLGVAFFVVFAALSAMLAFVSSAVIVPVGVYVWGKTVCMLLLWLGWILGGVCSYAISRYLGRRVAKVLLSGPMLERYEDSISRRAPFGLVLLFQLAVPSEVPGYLLGLARYHFWKYLCALALAELIYAVATTWLGASFIEGRTYALAAVGIAMALFAGVALHVLHRRISRNNAGALRLRPHGSHASRP
jgi:uncharacterized membrane protein YdjX (TVP38/TMEM64 family)